MDIDHAAGPGRIPSFAQGVVVPAGHRLLFVSGQAPQRPDGYVPEGFEEQCRLAWTNLVSVLSAAGMSVRNLVKVTVILADRGHREANARIRKEFLGDHRPAVLYLVAGLFVESWLLEIEAVAAG